MDFLLEIHLSWLRKTPWPGHVGKVRPCFCRRNSSKRQDRRSKPLGREKAEERGWGRGCPMNPEVKGDEQVRLSSFIQVWMLSWLWANEPTVSSNLKDLGK